MTLSSFDFFVTGVERFWQSFSQQLLGAALCILHAVHALTFLNVLFINRFLGSSWVFGELQDALNTIWEVQPKPGRGVITAKRYGSRIVPNEKAIRMSDEARTQQGMQRHRNEQTRRERKRDNR